MHVCSVYVRVCVCMSEHTLGALAELVRSANMTYVLSGQITKTSPSEVLALVNPTTVR